MPETYFRNEGMKFGKKVFCFWKKLKKNPDKKSAVLKACRYQLSLNFSFHIYFSILKKAKRKKIPNFI
jgi:hypothetical protein